MMNFAIKNMDVDWGAVGRSEGASGAGYFKKHALAKGLVIDISVGLPRIPDAVLRAGLPLQDIAVKLAKVHCHLFGKPYSTDNVRQVDVGFSSLHAVHVFGILEELLDGLFRKDGIMEYLDILLDNGPPQSRPEIHRKRQVLVQIEKLILRLLPLAVRLRLLITNLS